MCYLFSITTSPNVENINITILRDVWIAYAWEIKVITFIVWRSIYSCTVGWVFIPDFDTRKCIFSSHIKSVKIKFKIKLTDYQPYLTRNKLPVN